MPVVKRPVCLCMALTVWAVTRCWIWWYLAALPVCLSRSSCAKVLNLKDASEADIERPWLVLTALILQAGEKASVLRAELQTIMQNYFGVFRRGDFMQEGIEKLNALRPRIENVVLEDKSNAFQYGPY